ncbi:site-specific DNA-methyltransferase [Moraxella porci]|uniref:site-specific DNA-methyltransferase n=1 Tax=Moraxella porci TaxID=1288392 RepID=UPI00244B3505|nr:site-specific DNA-methyltransferase [Moraxella porci]MDH2273029.1 site-specific DNA-methyltransferase [Moraxella porci]
MKNQKLELTWIGKDKRPKLEARILLEDTEKSYHAPTRSEQAIFDNRLIFGDNLLALKALEQEFAGEVSCIYIDPPFNTGEAFENYDDGLEHSIWLGLMHERFKLLSSLLNKRGSIFVHLNDDELDYCKVVLDEVFGRSNFVNRITVEARSPSAFSTVNPGVFKSSEYILWYAKDKSEFIENSGRVSRSPDYAYNKWLDNPDEDFSQWRLVPLMDAYEKSPPSRSRRPDSLLEHFNDFIVNNAKQVCRLASISDSGAGERIVQLKKESLKEPGRVFKLERAGNLDDVYIIDGQQLIFYKKNVAEIDGKLSATALLTNIWKDIAWEGIANEGGVTFRKGKKPERLIKRCLELATNPGDLVLDSFAGSGTTGAVAHKMGRRWIMVELGEHCHTHIIPRLQKVIDGTDQGGISKAVNWQGGGGFRYYRLAPTLIVNDAWGNPIINPDYNPEMLAEALAKLEGFTYKPSETLWWQHGYSSERDFIYVTTQTLSAEQLQALSDEMGENQSLLVCCAAWRGITAAQAAERFANLSLKKIPKMVLARCEWGHDDYSLNVANLPMAEPKPMPSERLPENRAKTAKGKSAVENQEDLFAGKAGDE